MSDPFDPNAPPAPFTHADPPVIAPAGPGDPMPAPVLAAHPVSPPTVFRDDGFNPERQNDLPAGAAPPVMAFDNPEPASPLLDALHELDRQCAEQGHSLVGLIVWAAKNAFGINISDRAPVLDDDA